MYTQHILYALIPALFFSLVHLFSYRVFQVSASRFKRRIISLSGGMAAAYAFMDLLPSLRISAVHLRSILGQSLLLRLFLERAIFGVAFAGFLVFFLLDNAAVASRVRRARQSSWPIDGVPASVFPFMIHLTLTGLLSLIISYTLRFELQTGLLSAVLYTIALSLHFMVADESLEEHYRDRYVQRGRYVMAVMPLLGWILSVRYPEGESYGYVFLAFIAGAVLFNVIKDEMPQAGKGVPRYFLGGAILYAFLVLAIGLLG